MVSKDRPTIGILSTAINFWYNTDVFKGIRRVAEERGVNLRFFTGNRINSPHKVERDRNVIYRMINENNVDGIIAIAAGLCECLTEEETSAFFAAYAPLPVVGIGHFPGEIPQILTDNKRGIKEIMRHILRDHGYRKIAFISGPLANKEALIRLEAYKEALEEGGLEVDPAYIVYGNFTWTSSTALVSELLDKRKLKIEAIVCANDEMAFGVYDKLNERSINIPGDIALTGFDDVLEARYTFPPFTTVKQPFFNQGQAALSMVLDLLEGHKGDKREVRQLLPPELIIRKSCGCRQVPPSGNRDFADFMLPDEIEGDREFNNFEKIISGGCNKKNGFYLGELKKNICSLYSTLTAALNTNNTSSFFIAFKKQIYHEGVTEEDVNRWYKMLTLFKRHLENSTNDKTKLSTLYSSLKDAYILLEEIQISIIGRNKVKSDVRALSYQSTLERINSCLNAPELLHAVQVNFQRAGIECFYLSLYSNTLSVFHPSDLPINESTLVIGFNGNKIIRYSGDRWFNTSDLVPGKRFKYKRNDHFIIYPITINGYHFGTIALEYYDDKITMYDSLVESLCTTIGTIKEFNKIEETVKNRTQELEKANERLKDLDKVKTNFTANISHELRTPLTLILGPLESLLSGDYGNSILTGNRIFHSMHTNSVRLLKMINTLLDFSKIDAGKMRLNKEKTNLNKLLDFYISSIHSGIHSKGLTVEFIDHKDTIIVPLDRDLIEKAFFNLISNAIKFSHKGGTITISLECTKDKKEVLIRVKDRGIGIPADKFEAIFERFTQVDQNNSSSYEGTGIGLAFTKEIVELHQGSLSLESKPGKGSTFTIHLPWLHGRAMEQSGMTSPWLHGRAKEQSGMTSSMTGGEKEVEKSEQTKNAGQAEHFNEIKSWLASELTDGPEQEKSPGSEPLFAGDRRQTGTGRGKQNDYILIVDDNSSMREFIQSILETKYHIRTAVHGEDALEVIKYRKPNLIISDIMMPVMSGLELCRHLKQQKETAHIPLILLTARIDMATRIEGLEQKADDYLIKPFNARELFVRIENLLEKRRLEVELQEVSQALWSEMETAKQIQKSLLPAGPSLPGFNMTCYIQSASEVSGDYYDIIHTDRDSWLIIGDVSGHGVTAGLVMMMVQTAISSLLYKCPGITPAKLLSDLNRIINLNISKLGQEKYMTIMALCLTPQKEFLYSGLHQDIYIYREKTGTVEVLESKGMWIGFIDDISSLVQNDSFALEKGDTILLYTDGITEAVRKESRREDKNKRFGNKKLMDILKKNGHKKPARIKMALINELEHYICDDDFTFVIVQRN